MTGRLLRPSLALPALGALALSAALGAAQPLDEACLQRLPADRVSLNLREASIPASLRLLAQRYRLNMLVTEDVKGTATLDFHQVPARDVLRAIMEAGGLRCVVAGEVLRVSTADRLRAEAEAAAKAAEARVRADVEAQRRAVETRRAEQEFEEIVARGPIREETIRLQYADAEEVARTIQGILGLPPDGTAAAIPLPQLSQLYVPSPPVNIPDQPLPPAIAPIPPPLPAPDVVAKGLTVRAYKPTNSIFLRYYARDLERIRALIVERLDVPLPQVQIAAQMVITTLNDLQQLGVQWGGAGIYSIDRRTAVVGSGFASDPPRTGPGTPVVGPPTSNSGFTGSQLLPVDPTTGLPVGGSIVNLPTSLLPTVLGATPAAGLLLGIIGQNFALNLAIQALEVQGKARTLAEPTAVTVENARAVIARGFEVPFTSTPTQGVQNVQFKEALLKLEVTPRVIRENGETKIRMKVVFENNEPDFSRAVLTGGNPPIFKRRQETEVLVRQGDRLVIGGVTNEQAANTYRKVPWLGDLPGLGWLFKAREVSGNKEELIVIITPTVLSEAAPRAAR
jgi:type IV pilus assembly protein PilQ